ncbi:MAG: TldD/PmbA family protein [Thermoplasmata archaeon]|nr:MAG: TldD/PmbA family protein [Thermoplasmata archaeon]
MEKFDAFVMIESETESRQVKFYRNEIDVIKEWKDRTIKLVLYRKGKMLSFSIENPDDEKLVQAVKKAERMMKHLAPSPFTIGKGTDYVDHKLFDGNATDEECMVEKVETAIHTALEYGEEVAGILYTSITKDTVCNSNGVCCGDKNSMAHLSIRTFRGNNSAHAVSCSRMLNHIDGHAARDAGKYMNAPREVKKAEPGTYDVIFSPLAFADFISYFAGFVSAFAVDAGYSFLAEKVGKQVADENVTIYDSGIEKDGLFSRKCDEEGVATQKTVLVEDGVLRTYLHNGTTAATHGTSTTANAGIVAPHPWNTVVAKGDSTLEEMIEQVRDGLLITNVWYTRFQNYQKGDFSTVARDVALRIKNGKILHAVKGMRISDNLERMMKNITMLSKDFEQIYWWEVENPVFCPYTLVKDVRITTA